MRRAAIGLLAASLLAGCAARLPAEIDLPEVAPADLLVHAIVLAPGPAEPRVERRSGQFVLYPDGSLHYAPVPEGPPPRVRVLTQADVNGVWSVLRELNLAGADAGGHPGSWEAVALRGVPTVVVDVTAFDRRHRTIGDPDELAPLVRTLAALAWVPDAPAVGGRVPAKRYDLGPDPYLPYRRPASGG